MAKSVINRPTVPFNVKVLNISGTTDANSLLQTGSTLGIKSTNRILSASVTYPANAYAAGWTNSSSSDYGIAISVRNYNGNALPNTSVNMWIVVLDV